MSKVLLTGATGFIGHHLVDLLKSEGFDVRCLVRKTSNISKLVGKVEFAYGEVTSPESLEEAVKGVDYIVHLAGVVKALNPEGYYRVNTQGTINLFNATLKNNQNIKRFVFISSQAASRPSETPIKENEPSAPVTSYGKSKLETEKFLNQNSDKLPVTIIRPSAVYGPGDKEFLPVYQMINKGIEVLVMWKNEIKLCLRQRPSKKYLLSHAIRKNHRKNLFFLPPRSHTINRFLQSNRRSTR